MLHLLFRFVGDSGHLKGEMKVVRPCFLFIQNNPFQLFRTHLFFGNKEVVDQFVGADSLTEWYEGKDRKCRHLHLSELSGVDIANCKFIKSLFNKFFSFSNPKFLHPIHKVKNCNCCDTCVESINNTAHKSTNLLTKGPPNVTFQKDSCKENSPPQTSKL